MTPFSSLPYLTADLPGVGGSIRNEIEDFRVQEEPAYDPSGQGEHLYCCIQKEGKSTTEVARMLAKHFDRPIQDVGYAGMKDKWAVTQQCFTVRLADEKLCTQFKHPQVNLIWWDQHNNKMKPGHLTGNQFDLVIRGVDPLSVLRAKKILDVLEKEGVPNYYGPQRFGYAGLNDEMGACLLQQRWRDFLDLFLGPIEGPLEVKEKEEIIAARQAYVERDYERALSLWPSSHRHERQVCGSLSRKKSLRDSVLSMDREQLNFLVSAWQSEMFNRVLAQRIIDNSMSSVVLGDVAKKTDSGGVFEVQEPVVEQARAKAFEISATGPMWGGKMRQAKAEAGDIELSVLDQAGLSLEDFNTGRFKPDGSRRPLRVKLMYPEISGEIDEEQGGVLRMTFFLPAGAFATAVLREVMKVEIS